MLVDISCRKCGETFEILASDPDELECKCGSKDVERKWTAPPMYRMKGDIQGETPGERKYAMEITKRAREKNRREGGFSH